MHRLFTKSLWFVEIRLSRCFANLTESTLVMSFAMLSSKIILNRTRGEENLASSRGSARTLPIFVPFHSGLWHASVHPIHSRSTRMVNTTQREDGEIMTLHVHGWCNDLPITGQTGHRDADRFVTNFLGSSRAQPKLKQDCHHSDPVSKHQPRWYSPKLSSY